MRTERERQISIVIPNKEHRMYVCFDKSIPTTTMTVIQGVISCHSFSLGSKKKQSISQPDIICRD